MQTGLLSSLRRYSPRENHDPLENFVTEAFAWILKTQPNFGTFFIEKLSVKLETGNLNEKECEWVTQANFNGVYPDMVCYFDNKAIIFEHKVWSTLHKNQLSNYKNYALNNFDKNWIVLITASKKQHEQNPDIALCWNEIYQYVSEWMKENKNVTFIFNDFLQFLEIEGLGPPAPISHTSLKYYYTTVDLEKNLSTLVKRIEKRSWTESFRVEDINKWVHKKRGSTYGLEWGRIGVNFISWNPGIFVGVLLDGADHYTKPTNINKGPDFCLILSFDESLHRKYLSNKYYIEFVKNVSAQISQLNNGWEFYHHAKDDDASKKNKWHPIHIRKPLIDILAGTKNIEEQEEIFYQQAKLVLEIVTNENSFWSLRESLEQKTSNKSNHIDR